MEDLDKIFEEINGHGKFQKILLYFVFGPMFAFLPLAWNVELLLLNQVDHWCYHHMTDGLNETELSNWKACYLPIINEQNKSSSCEIYIPTTYTKENEELFWNKTLKWQTNEKCPWKNTFDKFKNDSSENKLRYRSPCKRNWSYDNSEFKRTLVSDLNWVCNDSNRVQEQFTYSQVGILIGSMGLNFLADRYGRKTMLWISLAIVVIPMLAKTFLVQYYYLYTILNLIVYSGVIAVYQIPTSMLMEVVDESYRSWTMMYTWLIWIFGSCVLPLIGWIWGDWFVTSLIGVGAMASLFFTYPLVKESPRWLLSQKGRVVEAQTLIREIAKTNNRDEPRNLYKRLQDINEIILNEPKYGVISLFSRCGMAIKTVLLLICFAVNEWIYKQLLINIDNMEGSYFLNLLFMSLIEIPACFSGLWLANNLGRRWSQSGLLFMQAIVLALTCTIANHSEDDTASLWGVIAIVLVAKLINSASFMLVYLQAAEIYPTSIRTTGMGFIYCCALFLGLPGPFITGMAEWDKTIPYWFMAGLGIFGALTSSFLPETLGCYLAETVEQAASFGRNHKYFSMKVNKENKVIPVPLEEK